MKTLHVLATFLAVWLEIFYKIIFLKTPSILLSSITKIGVSEVGVFSLLASFRNSLSTGYRGGKYFKDLT